ncbi:MAG: 4'-phosphopantetheinyl transferase superfamily protein [Eubacterium sp.]|nr:4'-phosphopantetheinyl transferase superfamily protein [Eubacterium sp.]
MENTVFAIDTRLLEDRETFDRCYKSIRPERRERVDRMRFDNGKRLCLGSGVVMEAALAHAGCQDREIMITPQGKPTVEGCYFNLSDAGEIAVCAVSDREVGIDIERPRKLTEPLIQRAFTPAEIRDAEGDPDRFIRLWTIKESVMKWYGLGLALMPEHIDVTMAGIPAASATPDGRAGDIRVAIAGGPVLATSPEELRFTGFRYKDYQITVCSTYEPFSEAITWVKAGDISG